MHVHWPAFGACLFLCKTRYATLRNTVVWKWDGECSYGIHCTGVWWDHYTCKITLDLKKYTVRENIYWIWSFSGHIYVTALGFCDRPSWANCEVREKTNKMQQLDVYYQHFLNMFQASLCPSSGEQRPCVTAHGVLHWFCWMWLVAVVEHCIVGCVHCESNSNLHSARTLQHSAPQPLPTTSSRTSAAHHVQ